MCQHISIAIKITSVSSLANIATSEQCVLQAIGAVISRLPLSRQLFTANNSIDMQRQP